MNAILTAPVASLNPAATAFLRRLLPLLSPEMAPRAVGGFVRDALLGRQTIDLDVTVTANPIVVARAVAGALGGVLVVLDEPRQVARAVVQHEGVSWRVDVAPMQGDPIQDLAHRDFTVDAMSVSLPLMLEDGWQDRVLDPYGGRRDLQDRVIRAVGPQVFQEDGLRLLRAVRLAGSLGFDIEAGTQDLIRRDAQALDGISGERIRDEFLAILTARHAIRRVYLLDELGLLCRVVPELEQSRGVVQPKEHYWDVLHHNIETVGTVEGLLEREWEPGWVLDAVPWDDSLAAHFRQIAGDGHTRATIVKLAGLLHDIAKPATRTVDAEGRIRFRGHHSQGAEMVHIILQRLRLSRRSTDMIATEIEHHLRPGQMSQETELATPRAVYRYFRSAGDVAVDTLYLNMADYLAARGPLLEREEWETYAGRVRFILDTGLAQVLPPAPPLVNGHDLMELLGLSPGPGVGLLLEAVREAQAAGEVATREDALALARRLLDARGEEPHA